MITQNSKLKTKIRVQRLTIAIFLLMLYTPLTVMLLTPDQAVSSFENRNLAQSPDLQALMNRPLKQAFTTVETYINDQFGLRGVLAYMQGALYYFGFKKSPSESVLAGADDWLFYASTASEYSIEDYRGLMPLPEAYLASAAGYLQKRKDWLKSQGIDYLFVIAPDKHTIYPEYIPERYTIISHQRRIDQFIAYSQIHTDINILDLRQPLHEAKDEGMKVFLQYDTHWSSLGAYIGYRALMEQLQMDAIDLALFRPIPTQHRGDLGMLMGLRLTENTTIYELESACAVELPEQSEQFVGILPYWVEIHAFQCPTSDQRVLIFHDSFLDRMRPFLAEHFNQSVFIKARYAPELVIPLVDKFQPDVVIEEIVERRLHSYFDYGENGVP